jgi:hypothetical protein
MARREIRIEELLGARILDAQGQRVGRIEEMRAEHGGARCEITGYVIGLAGLLERLSLGRVARWLLPALGLAASKRCFIPWDALDLSDPRRPRLHKPLEEVRRPYDPGPLPTAQEAVRRGAVRRARTSGEVRP